MIKCCKNHPLYLTACLLIISCSNKSEIIGKWYMHQVFQDSTDVSNEHNPANNRFIEFFADGTFRSGGDPNGENTGEYSFDEKGILFLDSDAGPDDDSYWSVAYSNSQMKWNGVGAPRAERFTIVHQRVK